jgi:flagellar biogenesis protein FliO
MTPLGRYVVETVVTLSLVLGLAVLILFAARRVGIGRPSGPLSIAGRLVLDPRRAIYLVRVADSVYVIGASEAGLAKLGELDPKLLGAFEPAGRVEAAGFRQVLERLRGTAPAAEAGDESEKP